MRKNLWKFKRSELTPEELALVRSAGAEELRKWRLKNNDAYNASRRKKYAESVDYRAKEKIRAKNYRQKNLENERNRRRRYRLNNRELVNLKRRMWCAKNKDKVAAYRKAHQRGNYKDRNRIYKAKSYEKKKKNPEFIVVNRLRARLYAALNLNGVRKAASTIALCGCTPHELMLHLQSKFQEGMHWNNYGKWHIDHIRPCASFDLTDPEQQKQCFHYTNLQPLWAAENIRKGAKVITPHETHA